MDKLNGLKITRRLIKEAIPDNSESCPIAMAMQGKVDGIPRVYPKETVILKENKGETIWINHTQALIDWINQFDKGGYGHAGGPQPITLEITETGYLGIKEAA